MMRLTLLALPVLAACTPVEQTAPSSAGPETCPKSEFNSLIGTDVNAAILPLTLTYRTVWPGEAVTLDHLPERMNIAVNDDGIVQGLTCG
jgi:hypothetical protein